MKPSCGFRRLHLPLYEGVMHQRGTQAIDYHRAGAAMGTLFEVFLQGDDEQHLEAVAVAVLEEVGRLDTTLSRFDPRSEISRINREARHKPVRIDRELFALLARCEQARELTEGYFDVVRGRALSLNAECGTVQLGDVAEIDLGGVGKGYALDCGAELLTRFGVRAGLLQGGTSSVRVVGPLATGRGWPLAVRHPLLPAMLPDRAPIAELELAAGGFSCSAVRQPGQAQSDILNPLCGVPLEGNAVCVVLAQSATEAEIFSTALLAMGRVRAVQYLAQGATPDLTVGWFDDEHEFAWLTRK